MTTEAHHATQTPTDAVMLAVGDWWRGFRPSGWSEEAHRMSPTINCATAREQALAAAFVEWLEKGSAPRA